MTTSALHSPGDRLASLGYPRINLPALAGRVSEGVTRGRVPAQGYARGWGLEFGALAEQIARHPLYIEALAVSRSRSVVHMHRLMNLFLLVSCYLDALPSQNIVEFGSYRGGSALFLAHLLQRLYPQASLYAHDTFSGMPTTSVSADLHTQGDFADADLAGLLAAREESGLERMNIVVGLVQSTFPGSVPAGTRFGLAHLDMDIYEPTAFAQAAVLPMMCAGGYLVYDDATVSSCMGATQAVEELIQSQRLHSEQVYPHFVFRAGLERGAS